MKCPVCKTNTLVNEDLPEGPPSLCCSTCNGTFISSTRYWPWLKTQTLQTEIPLDDTDASRVEVTVPKICPECGHLLTRYKVWPSVAFLLDSCGHCNGIWLDSGEWQTLLTHNLHNRINLFLTRPWQEKIRLTEARKTFEAMYLERFGPEDYARIKEIRAWLDQHPRRHALLSYLSDTDPYRA